MNLELADDRIYDFLDTVGTDECRAAIRETQLQLLRSREEALPRLKWHAKGAGMTFNYMSVEKAFEYAVLEYPFSFWQLGHDCSSIPAADAPIDTLLDHFVEVVGLGFYADASMNAYASHYYQAGDEMGYYGFQTAPFKGLLEEITEAEPTAIFMPGEGKMGFQPGFVEDVFEWTQGGADKMIYIYGAIDTWTATGVPVSEEVDAQWYIMPGKDHGSARIRNLPASDREALLSQLRTWIEEAKNE